MSVIPAKANPPGRLPLFLAVALSLGLHAALWRLNPSILLTGGSGFESPEQVSPHQRLRLDALMESRPRSEAADLEQRLSGAEGGEMDLPTAQPDLGDLEASFPDIDTGLAFMEGEFSFAPLEPDALPEGPVSADDSWQARPEILAIREQRVEARPDARPREIVSRVETDEPVADILPSLAAEGALDPGPVGVGFFGAEFEDTSGRPRPLSAPGGGIPLGLAGDGGAGEGFEWSPELRPSGLSSGMMDDTLFPHAAEVADQLLRITAQTYLDPSRPDYRYFKVQLRPSELEELEVMPREVLFLLDATSRVTPEAFQQVARAVGTVLGELAPGDRFNLFLLQTDVTQLFDESQAATPLNLARARGRLAQTRPQGRGDLFAGLNMLLKPADTPDRLRIGVVVTDGVPSLSVEESAAYIERFTRGNRGEISIFTVGVGRQVNRYLLDFLSFQNRGDSLVTEQTVQIGDALRRTLLGVRRPVLRHLTYRFADGDRLWVYPESLTHLYLDRPLILVGRIPADQKALTFQIVGHSQEGAHDMLYTLDVNRIPPGPWSLRQDWAWQAVLKQVSDYLQLQDPAVLERIRGLSRAYGITVPYLYIP
ncbi:MAG: VWA domain-containing protein [Verrucomicrobia bacterium]|nr:VWA domain-containing protein [Verrucomicrobiota bacterium]MCH8526901.1 VWA domain-containing protein [Kiritimatiellia bacterium]